MVNKIRSIRHKPQLFGVFRLDMLAKRLETDNSTEFQKFATICHVVSGNLEAFTNAVQKLYDEPDERSSRLQVRNVL